MVGFRQSGSELGLSAASGHDQQRRAIRKRERRSELAQFGCDFAGWRFGQAVPKGEMLKFLVDVKWI